MTKKNISQHWFWDFAVLWPLIWVALFIVSTFTLAGSVASMIERSMEPGTGFFSALALVFLVHMLSIILGYVAWIRTVHVMYTQSDLDNDKKILWFVLMLLFHVIAMPILHFTHLRK